MRLFEAVRFTGSTTERVRTLFRRPLDTRNNLAKRLILPMKIAIGF